MIRAAAKNFQDVAIVVAPEQYEPIMAELAAHGGGLTAATHWHLAQQAFVHTAAYDKVVSATLLGLDATPEELPATLQISAPRAMVLRYGENPHQKAALYKTGDAGIAGAEQLLVDQHHIAVNL